MPSRASHTKTRNGCLRCKKRRVKCDEEKPCRGCSRRNELCSLVTDPQYIASFNEGSTTSRSSSGVKATPSNHQSATASPVISPQGQNDLFDFVPGWQHTLPSSTRSHEWAEDLHLMAHWTVTTCPTLHSRPGISALYQKTAPELAVNFPPMMHMILSLSALHLAYLRPDEREKNTTISMRYQHYGTKQFQVAIQNITKDNILAVFLTSSLFSVAALANLSAAKHGSFTATDHSPTLDDIIAVFVMTRGSRDILHPARARLKDAALDHILEPMINRQAVIAPEAYELPPDLAQRLQFLRTELLEKHTGYYDSSKEACLFALLELEKVFIDVVHLPAENQDSPSPDYATRTDLELGVLMKWQTLVSSNYINLLKQKQVAALVVLVHWVMLFRHIGPRWFLDGWMETAFGLIRDALEEEDRHWLQWSEEYAYRT